MAADVVQDNMILVAYANCGAQAAVVNTRHEWDTSKQVTSQHGDAALTIKFIQMQWMPQTRLGTCPNGSQLSHE